MERAPCITGIRIKELRDERGWSLQRLSDEALAITGQTVSPQAISAIELGGSQNPTNKILKPLAKALETSLDYLSGEDIEEMPRRMIAATA